MAGMNGDQNLFTAKVKAGETQAAELEVVPGIEMESRLCGKGINTLHLYSIFEKSKTHAFGNTCSVPAGRVAS